MSSPPAIQATPSPDAEAIIIVKAAPQLSTRHGETVCTAAITRDRRWVRLYPIAFGTLQEAQQFGRWDVVRYAWRAPRDDRRQESQRVEHHTLTITGNLSKSQRIGLINPMVKGSLADERARGRSLAFTRPTIRRFLAEKKPDDEITQEREKFQAAAKQSDLFLEPIVPYQPCPYRFKYDYEIADGRPVVCDGHPLLISRCLAHQRFDPDVRGWTTFLGPVRRRLRS
jgi:hypothetical protein